MSRKERGSYKKNLSRLNAGVKLAMNPYRNTDWRGRATTDSKSEASFPPPEKGSHQSAFLAEGSMCSLGAVIPFNSERAYS